MRFGRRKDWGRRMKGSATPALHVAVRGLRHHRQHWSIWTHSLKLLLPLSYLRFRFVPQTAGPGKAISAHNRWLPSEGGEYHSSELMALPLATCRRRILVSSLLYVSWSSPVPA